MLYDAKRLKVISVITSFLHSLPNNEHWNNRFLIEQYIDKCIQAGFCVTDDQIRLCIKRYIAGKRKITPPGTSFRKKEKNIRAKLMLNLPQELLKAVDTVVSQNEKAVKQYIDGNEKAINAIVGGVMKLFKFDATIVKELVISSIKK